MVLGIFFVLGFSPGPIQAQDEVASPYQSFNIYIYPEYDHPGVGIVVEGEVLPGHFPRYLEMQVPEETSMALLMRPDQSGAGGERIDIQKRDGKAFLPVDVSGARFQVQFYFNPFKDEGPDRTFAYELATNEILPEFHVIIQRPTAAVDFQHSLVDPEEVEGEFGLIYYREHIEGLQPDEVHTINIAYKNPENTLTLRALQARMEQAQSQGNADPPTPRSKPFSIIMVVLVVGVLSLGLYVVLKRWGGSGAGRVPVASQAKRGETPGKGRGSERSGDEKFCPNCGTPRRPNARFCSSCGKEF